MPQFLLAAAAGAAAYATYRILRREMSRVAGRLAEVRVPTELDTPAHLVRGPDGVYRPDR